jgi:ABC-2 type transport system permease protein
LWLLAFEVRLTWRTWRSGSNPQSGARVSIFVVAVILALLIGLSGAFLLARLNADGVAYEDRRTIISLGALLVFQIMVSHALIAATDVVHVRRDLDLLLSSPVSPWSVMMARACGLLPRVGGLYLAALGAILIWTPLTGGYAWLALAPTTVALTLLATGTALVLAKFLFAWIGPRHTRVAAQVLAALIGVGVILAIQGPNIFPRQERAEIWGSILAAGTALQVGPDSLVWVPARAAMGDLGLVGAMLLVSICFFAASVWWFSRSFIADAASVDALDVRRRGRPLSQAIRIRPGVFQAIVRKEWRLLWRDPMLLTQMVFPILYLAPLLALAWTRGDGEDAKALSYPWLGAGLVMIAGTLASNLAWVTASAEDAPDLLTVAPVARATIDRGKLAAAIAPVVILICAPTIAIAFHHPFAAAASFACAVCAAISTGLTSIWTKVPARRADFAHKRSANWMTSFGQTLMSLAWAGAAACLAFGQYLFAALPALLAIGVTLAYRRPAS